MNFLKTGGLALAFTIAADVVMAGGMGMVGVHGWVVEGGAALGETLGVPQLDWMGLWENQELTFLDAQTDPCLSLGGHYHGATCHAGTGLNSALSIDEAANALQPQPLGFES